MRSSHKAHLTTLKRSSQKTHLITTRSEMTASLIEQNIWYIYRLSPLKPIIANIKNVLMNAYPDVPYNSLTVVKYVHCWPYERTSHWITQTHQSILKSKTNLAARAMHWPVWTPHNIKFTLVHDGVDQQKKNDVVLLCFPVHCIYLVTSHDSKIERSSQIL